MEEIKENNNIPENNSQKGEELEIAYYNMKNIKFNGKKATIILQNKNGPCPL